MPIVRRLARPLLAASFISAGVDSVLHPRPRAEGMRPVVQRLAPALRLPQDPELFVRANGAAMAGAGTLLALGRLPRLSALALVATLLPATYSEHAFWQEKDPQARRASRKLFLRDAGLLGGALLAMVDTEGRPGALWLGRNAVRQTEKAGRRAGGRARRRVEKAGRRVEKAGRRAGKAGPKVISH